MSDFPPHSGLRWEPAAPAPEPAASEPTQPLPPSPRPPGPAASDDERDSRRDLPVLLPAMLAVLALLATGGWVASSSWQRQQDGPATGATQAPFSGRQGGPGTDGTSS